MDYAMKLAEEIAEKMQHPGWQEDARRDIANYNPYAARRARWDQDDLWNFTFPVHANEYIAQLEEIAPNKTAEEKLHHVAVRLKNHALLPQNWAECEQCKTERMDKEL